MSGITGVGQSQSPPRPCRPGRLGEGLQPDFIILQPDKVESEHELNAPVTADQRSGIKRQADEDDEKKRDQKTADFFDSAFDSADDDKSRQDDHDDMHQKRCGRRLAETFPKQA